MRPSDHPDFFRLPPPEGRSRESSIRLDRDGRFFHDGELVTHRGMARAFASWVARHPDDGRFILTNGYDWTYFTVESTPYFVEGVRHGADGPVLALFDGSEEPLDPSTLRLDDDGIFAPWRRTARSKRASRETRSSSFRRGSSKTTTASRSSHRTRECASRSGAERA